jgi:aminoglycoside phosphotransferase (APT) family kinase protein
VVVHGDFHGDNQVWADGRLRVVLDFETVALAEPEYDFRGVCSVGPSVDLLVRTLRHYQRAAGRELSLDRVTAWHVRTVLGDLVWRSEAGLGPGDGRTVPEWLDDLAVRLRRLGIVPAG